MDRSTPRHQCLIYEGSPSADLQSLSRTLIQHLDANYRCMYLNTSAMVADMRTVLVAAGLDVEGLIATNKLILSSEQNHLIDGKFDIDRMIKSLASLVDESLALGFVGLWSTGDMNWEFGDRSNLVKLLAYEERLDSYMRNNPGLTAVCQYHRDTLPLSAVECGLRTHQAFYLSDTLSRKNLLYKPRDTVS